MSKEIMTRKYHRKHYKFEMYGEARWDYISKRKCDGTYCDKFYCDSFEEADNYFYKKWGNCCCYLNHYFEVYDRYEKRYLTDEEVEKLMNM
mgnify:CR=1 FL=1